MGGRVGRCGMGREMCFRRENKKFVPKVFTKWLYKYHYSIFIKKIKNKGVRGK